MKKSKTIVNIWTASSATIIFISALYGRTPFLIAAGGTSIGYGLRYLICEADELLNDDKMTLGLVNEMGFREENSTVTSASTLLFI